MRVDSPPHTDVEPRVAERLRGFGVEVDTPVLALISGGADSTLLLVSLARTTRNVRALHVAHAMRGTESEADRRHCEALAADLRIPIEVVDGAVDEGGNLEARLRERRREAVRLHAAGDLVATGHTLSDRAETALYRLAASGTPHGLAALPPRDGQWIRPLIDLTRCEVREILAAGGIDWRDDASNLDPTPARNRVRLEVLPALGAAHPGAERNLARAALLADDERDLLNDLAERLITAEGAIDLAAFDQAHTALQRIALRRAARRHGITLGHADVEALRGGSPRRTLPGAALAERTSRLLVFLPPGTCTPRRPSA
jgi:tRNA(Ile)-lysidine synthase